ncbi:MAG: protein phosphatase 2C domain-containing protein [Epsilonproteobacteria bacterium]|nr:protein phosphatase 2C domain-containing protein [Campylobacterota bacterium]
MYSVASITDAGLKRDENEDAILVAKEYGLFMVSDGMGGHARGEVASQMIVNTFHEIFAPKESDETESYDIDTVDGDETIPYFSDDLDEDETITYENEEWRRSSLNEKLNRAIEFATHKIKNYANEKLTNGQIGATVVGIDVIEDDKEIAVFHLGDSRAYRIRDKQIEKLTIDHSKYEQMKQSGEYTEEELAKVNRNSITKAVGNFKSIPLEINYFDLRKDDIYLLCSDGVSDLTHAKELLEIILEEQENLEEATLRIKNLVYQRGAKDNLSMIVFRYG